MISPNNYTELAKELARLDEAATPAPWYGHNPDDSASMNAFVVTAYPSEPFPEDFSGDIILATLMQSAESFHGPDERWVANMELAVYVRNNLRAIVKALDAAEKMRKLLSELRADYGGHDEGCSARFNKDGEKPYRCRCGHPETLREIDAIVGGAPLPANPPAPPASGGSAGKMTPAWPGAKVEGEFLGTIDSPEGKYDVYLDGENVVFSYGDLERERQEYSLEQVRLFAPDTDCHQLAIDLVDARRSRADSAAGKAGETK